MRTLKPVGIAGIRLHERVDVSVGEEPGSEKVSARTRAFEEIDAQVFPGPGRGATRSEAAASDRWNGPSPATVEAYRRMFDLVVNRQPPLRMSRRDPAVAADAQAAGGTKRPARPAGRGAVPERVR